MYKPNGLELAFLVFALWNYIWKGIIEPDFFFFFFVETEIVTMLVVNL